MDEAFTCVLLPHLGTDRTVQVSPPGYRVDLKREWAVGALLTTSS